MKNAYLLQLSDSSLPVGGYAFSSGLESGARTGMIRNRKDLFDFIFTSTEQSLHADFPFTLETRLLIKDFSVHLENISFASLIWEYDALVSIPEMNKSSRTLGRALIDICHELEIDKQEVNYLPTVKFYFTCNTLPFHYPICLGLISNALELDTDSLYDYFIFTTQRDQINAAVRLGLIGPREGAKLLADLLRTKHSPWKVLPRFDSAGKSAPLLEIAQANHSILYTKLFQN